METKNNFFTFNHLTVCGGENQWGKRHFDGLEFSKFYYF